ncbi:MAG: acetyl-coenzyme A synthetase N-terminal domain-containing protein, partial [Pseudomonadota bacterium]
MLDEAHRWGRLNSANEEAAQREEASSDPGSYHGNIAARELHWFDGRDWVRRNSEGTWQGLDCGHDPSPKPAHPDEWTPWTQAFDDSAAPFYHWFGGAQTNACFNEVDRHVLEGRGGDTALVFEGDRWDPSRNDGRGGPVQETTVSYRQLLLETVLRAEVLRSRS